MVRIFFTIAFLFNIAYGQIIGGFVNSIGQLEGYAHRKTVVIDNRGAAESLDDKQVRILLTESNFDFDEAEPDGADIVFTGADGTTIIPHWIELYSETAATIWIKAQDVPSGSVASLYMYYGDEGATTTSSFDNTMLTVDQYGNAINAYLFTEGSGTTVASALGGSAAILTGTWAAHPTSETRFCANLTSEGDRVQIPFTWTKAGTFGFTWIPNVQRTIGSADNKRLFEFYFSAGNYIDAYLSDADGRLYIYSVQGGDVEEIYTYQNNFKADTAYEFVVTWDSVYTRLYVNNIYSGRGFTNIPDSGTASTMYLGAYYAGSGSPNLTLTGKYTDYFQTDTVVSFAQVEAFYQDRVYYQKDMASKIQKAYYPDFPGDGAGDDAVAESTILFEEGVMRMWYAKGEDPVSVYYAESYDTCQTWTNEVKIIGTGSGGEVGTMTRPAVEKDGDTYYCYYIVAGGGDIRVQASTTPNAFGTTIHTALEGDTEGFEGFFNVGVKKDPLTPDLWHMIAEGYKSSEPWKWANCYYRSTTGPLGPFLPVEGTTNPRTTLRIGTNNTTNNAFIDYVNNQWQIIQHQTSRDTGSSPGTYQEMMGLTQLHITPSEHFAFTTEDFNTFVPRYNSQPIMRVEYMNEVDQLGDPDGPIEITGAGYCIMSHDQCDNGILSGGTRYFKLAFSKIGVRRDQFYRDLTVTLF